MAPNHGFPRAGHEAAAGIVMAASDATLRIPT